MNIKDLEILPFINIGIITLSIIIYIIWFYDGGNDE